MTTPNFEEIFKQIRINFSLMGIPSDGSKLTIKFYILLTSLTLMIFEEMAFFACKMSPENVLELTSLAPCLCVGTLSVLKIIPVAWNRKIIFSLAGKLNNLTTEILGDAKKKHIVHRDIEGLRKLIRYFFVLNLMLIAVYNFSTPVYILYHYITTKEQKFTLPYAVIVPFSTERWLTWTIVYLHSIISGFICVLYFTSVDILYFILTSYICSMFTILSHEIRDLNKNNEKILVEIVKRHQYFIWLADDLEIIFKLPNFFNVLVGSIEICALGFNLMIGDWSDVPGCILFISSVLLQMFVMSVFGERLIRESSKVGEAAFLCEWIDMDNKSKKIILMLILRSQKAQKLTANKFSTICYQGFTSGTHDSTLEPPLTTYDLTERQGLVLFYAGTTQQSPIISNSWSYFTILRTVYSSEDN